MASWSSKSPAIGWTGRACRTSRRWRRNWPAAAVKALEFDAQGLGRWDSALMVRILALHDLCAKGKVEFRAETLPAGLAKLIALSQAVPEKKDAARKDATPSFLQRVGESGLAAWTGGAAMLSFMGESVVALLKLLRGRAQFRWSDTLAGHAGSAGRRRWASWP